MKLVTEVSFKPSFPHPSSARQPVYLLRCHNSYLTVSSARFKFQKKYRFRISLGICIKQLAKFNGCLLMTAYFSPLTHSLITKSQKPLNELQIGKHPPPNMVKYAH